MIKKLIGTVIFIFCLTLLQPVFLYALNEGEGRYVDRIADKFSRGLGNIVYAGGELPRQIAHEVAAEDYVYGIPKGIVKGAFYTVGRAITGVYEAVTFVIPQDQIIPNFYD